MSSHSIHTQSNSALHVNARDGPRVSVGRQGGAAMTISIKPWSPQW